MRRKSKPSKQSKRGSQNNRGSQNKAKLAEQARAAAEARFAAIEAALAALQSEKKPSIKKTEPAPKAQVDTHVKVERRRTTKALT